jgi:predicted SAM-dependent methyltransferase
MRKSAAKLAPAPEPPKLLKLDLGSGQSSREGFEGVDFVAAPGVKHVVDLLKFPWPFPDGSCDELHCSHFFEHVPGLLRGKFMDEVYRILVPEGKITIICPYYTSIRATQDFTHEWPPVSPNSFLYFNRKWREDNKLTHGHYEIKSDFDFVYGYAINASWSSRQDEARQFGFDHYNNTIDDLHVTLTKRRQE